VALEVSVVGLAGVVAFGNAGHRGRESGVCHDRCSPRWMRVDMSLTLSESREQAPIRQYNPYGQVFWVGQPIVLQEGYEDGRREDRPGAHLRDEPGREVDLQDAAENGSAGRGVRAPAAGARGVAGREGRRGAAGFDARRSRAGGVVGGIVAVLLRVIGGG